MIVEFFGLPGAGKTSLERATLANLKARPVSATSRDEAVSAYIAAWSRVSRERRSPLTRAASAAYKAALIRQALFDTPRLLRVNDLPQAHLARAATRVAENVRLYPWLRAPERADGLVVLCEGIVQHTIAYLAWQRLLRPARRAPDLEPVLRTLVATDSLLVFVDLPRQAASQRLTARGVPPLWPRKAPTDAVLDAFASAIREVLAALRSGANATLVEVDAARADAAWQEPAGALAERIVQGPSGSGGSA